MRTSYNKNQRPGLFRIEFGPDPLSSGKAMEVNDRDEAVSQSQGITRITKGKDTLGYEVLNQGENTKFIETNIIRWIIDHASGGFEKNDLEAIKLLKEWTTWLVAIDAAVIGAIAVGLKDFKFRTDCMFLSWMTCATFVKILATGAICFLGLSIIVAMYLLLALPAAAQRLPPEEIGADIYSMRTRLRIKLYWFVRPKTWFSVIGFVLVAILIIATVWTSKAAEPAPPVSQDLKGIETQLDSAVATLAAIQKTFEAIKPSLSGDEATLLNILTTAQTINEQFLDIRIAQPVDLSYLKGQDCKRIQLLLKQLALYTGLVDGICDGLTSAAARKWQLQERRTIAMLLAQLRE